MKRYIFTVVILMASNQGLMAAAELGNPEGAPGERPQSLASEAGDLFTAAASPTAGSKRVREPEPTSESAVPGVTRRERRPRAAKEEANKAITQQYIELKEGEEALAGREVAEILMGIGAQARIAAAREAAQARRAVEARRAAEAQARRAAEAQARRAEEETARREAARREAARRAEGFRKATEQDLATIIAKHVGEIPSNAQQIRETMKAIAHKHTGLCLSVKEWARVLCKDQGDRYMGARLESKIRFAFHHRWPPYVWLDEGRRFRRPKSQPAIASAGAPEPSFDADADADAAAGAPLETLEALV